MKDSQTRLRTLDGFKIDTVYHTGKALDIAIWMHGITVNKDEYLNFFRHGAVYLAEKNIASIRFDFRGHGKSSGAPVDFSIIGQNLDVEAVIHFAQKEYGRTGLRLHFIGASFGAPPAIFAASRYADIVKTVCLISPVLSYKRTFLQPETEWAKEIFSAKHLQRLEQKGRLYFDKKFYVGVHLIEEMRVIRPDISLRDLTQPVLVFHGDRDSMVPYAATVEACRGLSNVTLVTLKDTDHGFMIAGDDDGQTRASQANKKLIYKKLVEHITC